METSLEGMTETKGEEGTVFESRGGGGLIEDKDSCLAKMVKEEGESPGDGTKEQEREGKANAKVERLRRLLADDPKKLSNKDVEEAINYLNVDEIISLALEARQKGSDDGDENDDGENSNKGEELGSKVLDSVRSMLSCIELTETRRIRLVYEKWPPKAFATVLLSALDSYAFRRSANPLKYMDYYDIIPKLCGVLPFKLFAHILGEKKVFCFGKERDEEDEKETRQLQKEAAEGCGFCLGKAEHTGMVGEDCTLMEAVPIGTRVPAGYSIECGLCGEFVGLYDSIFKGCSICGDDNIGRAVPFPRWYLKNNN